MKKHSLSGHIPTIDRSGLFGSGANHCGKTLSEIRDDIKLKRRLQQAVLADRAPECLIKSIRDMIRV